MKQLWMERDPISQQMKEQVVLPFVQQLSLDANQAFEILNAYFSGPSYRRLVYFTNCEDQFNQLQNQMSQQ